MCTCVCAHMHVFASVCMLVLHITDIVINISITNIKSTCSTSPFNSKFKPFTGLTLTYGVSM